MKLNSRHDVSPIDYIRFDSLSLSYVSVKVHVIQKKTRERTISIDHSCLTKQIIRDNIIIACTNTQQRTLFTRFTFYQTDN